MISIIGIIGTFSIVIVFSIYFLKSLYSYIKSRHLSIFFFMCSFLCTIVAYLAWGLRVILVPQFESNKDILMPYWMAAYIFASLSLIFLDFAVIKIIGYRNSSYLKIILGIILATYAITGIILIVMLILGFDVRLVTFMDVSDLSIKDPVIYFILLCLLLFYCAIPNIIFTNHLREIVATKKVALKSKNFKRIFNIEFGILLFSIGTIIDGARFTSNIGMLITRIIIAIGGLFMLRGFYTKSNENGEKSS